MQRSANENSPVVLELEGLTRSYFQGSREIRVLDHANARLHAGEAVALVGPSGAGKSTLLHMAGLLGILGIGKCRHAATHSRSLDA